MLVALAHRQLMLHAVLALAQHLGPTAHRRYPLAHVEVEACDICRIDLPATHHYHLLDDLTRAADDYERGGSPNPNQP
jgi:hypothetical protein